MTETKTIITDAELIEKIKTSHLEEGQKTELGNLVSAMTTEERDELLRLIDESNKIDENTEKEKSKKLSELNKEYQGKLKELTRKESEYVRKECEKFDQKEVAGELKQVESEIAKDAKSKAEIAVKENERQQLGKAKKHTLRTIFFFLIFLALIIAGVLYGLEYLNTL